MKTITAYITYLLLPLIVVALLWTLAKEPNHKINTTHTEETSFKLEEQPQEYMVNAFVTIYTETGALKDQLSADYWAYSSFTKNSFLTMPHLTVYKPDGTLWQVNAKEGSLEQPTIGTIEKIVLSDHVVLERPGNPTTIPIKLETEKLDYHPKKQYAESDQWITMTKPGLKVTGLGLRAFLDKSTVELLNNVKTYYTVAR